MKRMQPNEESGKPESRINGTRKASMWFLVIGLLVIMCWDYYRHGGFHHTPPAIVQHMGDGLAIEALEGTQRTFKLPDGTTVWLNAGTILYYRADMGSGKREVELGTGEAFFEVAAAKDRPFLVHAGEILIEQLGTQFNVQNYPEEKICKTVVEIGSVKVTYRDNQLVLHEDDEVDLSLEAAGNPSISLSHGVNANLIAGWVGGFVVFDNEDLYSVLYKLGRAYNVKIKAMGTMPATKFSGSFPRSESLEDLINHLDFHGYKATVTRKDPHAVEIYFRQ
jgi:transmembrane sensor